MKKFIKLVQINGGVFGSTGKIMFGISDTLKKYGGEDLCFAPVTSTNKNKEPEHPYLKIGKYRTRQLNVLFSRLTGIHDCLSVFATIKVLSRIKRYNPDIIHLHNMHGDYLNLPMLFRFIKKNNIKVVWTLHDCWAFTGHCPHFTIEKCDKWKTGCYSCPRYREYPQSLFDNSKKMYHLKKKWFTGIRNLTIVTPSQWLADLVKQSFLNEYPVKVINNGINLDVFKPTESNFREKYNIPRDKFIVLGVAFGWGYRKGLDVFVELSKRLSDKYQIVLVGTDHKTDEQLPDNIISIHRTENQTELAEIYTAADVFANPTREEMFGLVNIEALACETPLVTFNTGGCPECIDEKCGSVVDRNDIDSLKKEIIRICEQKPYGLAACIGRAKAFSMNNKFKEYINLY